MKVTIEFSSMADYNEHLPELLQWMPSDYGKHFADRLRGLDVVRLVVDTSSDKIEIITSPKDS